MTSQERLNQLRKEHEQLLDQLRSLYEESPQLQEDAPDGLPESLQSDEDDTEPTLDPPDVAEEPTDDESERLEPPTVAPDEEASPPPVPSSSADETEPAPPSADQLIYEREAAKSFQRKQRLHARNLEPDPTAGMPNRSSPEDVGGQPEIDVDDAVEEAGVRDPERADLREMGDMAFNMREYNRQLIDLLREMQDIMQDGIAEMETIRARFHRMR